MIPLSLLLLSHRIPPLLGLERHCSSLPPLSACGRKRSSDWPAALTMPVGHGARLDTGKGPSVGNPAEMWAPPSLFIRRPFHGRPCRGSKDHQCLVLRLEDRSTSFCGAKNPPQASPEGVLAHLPDGQALLGETGQAVSALVWTLLRGLQPRP